MLIVETVAKIRRAHFVQGKSIKEICRELRLSRKVVRKVLRSDETAFAYQRSVQPRPRLGPWTDALDDLLAANAARSSRERVTLTRIFEDLRGVGYEGGYDAVRRYAASWRRRESAATAAAFVPLIFDPGEAYQFDWSHEIVLVAGATVTIKVAHMRLCHSRMPFVRAYPRETQEMVFDAHDKAFAFFGGACTRGVYDNMKTAVDAILVGKDRAYNRRFQQMCGHYLVEPVACTPASGWEKGQVESQVGTLRQNFFAPRVRVKSLGELNDWLADRCVEWAKARPHPEIAGKTIWEVFEGEPFRAIGPSDNGERAPASCRIAALSTASTRSRRRSPRHASFGSTTTSTRSTPAPLVGLWRSTPMQSASRSGRKAASSASTPAPSAAAGRSTIPGTTCRCWPASPLSANASIRLPGDGRPCAMAPRSGTGSCRSRLSASGAS